MDVTECPIEAVIAEWLYYSVKKSRHTLKYEIACSMVDSTIIWINGPFPGSTHDLTIARAAFIRRLGIQEKALADKAYVGDMHFIPPYRPARTNAERVWNRQHHQVRQKIERLIKRVKQFCILKETWRHDLDLHHIVFTVCCNITNICLLNEPLDRK